MDPTSVVAQLYAGSPVAVGVALVAIALAARKSVLATAARLGERVGALEQGRLKDQQRAVMERARRWQIEAALIEAGLPIPAWPDMNEPPHQPPTARHSLPPDWRPK